MFEDAPMDINMEKIMARFNSYSQSVSQSSSNNDDDDEDEEIDLRDTNDQLLDTQFELEPNNDNSLPSEYLTQTRPSTPMPLRKIEVELPENTNLVQDFVDHSYWR